MFTLFGIAQFVIFILLVLTVVQSVFYKKDMDELTLHYNISYDQNTTYKYWIWNIWVGLVFIVLGFIFPPFLILYLISSIASKAIAWVWLYQSYKKGFINIWWNELKASFESKK